jgi:hypothetical protein
MREYNNKKSLLASALQRTVQWVATHWTVPMTNGMLFALGFFGTTILAVAISGTITTWTTGQVLKSSDLNLAINAFKTAIEGIPNWTKAANGTDAYYNAGRIGIGTSTPGVTLDIRPAFNDNPLTAYSDQGNKLMTLGYGGVRAGNLSLYDGSNNNKIQISADSTNLTFFTANNVGIGTSSPTAALHVVGTTLAAVWSTSDERYKKNIQTIDSPMEKVLKLRGVNYEWRQSEFKDMKFKSGKDIGFIGQEVEKILPEVILKDDKGFISVAYSSLLPVVVEAFKELKKDHDLVKLEKAANEKKLLSLEEDNKRLRDDMARLRGTLEDRLRAIENLQMARK